MALREYIINNFWWKLLSLLLAAFTWLTIQTSFERDQSLRESPVVTTSIRTFSSIPITLLASTVTSDRFRLEPATVEVEISGSPDELNKLSENQVHAFVDIRNSGEEKQFRRNIQTQVPGNMKVTNVSQTFANVERLTAAQ